MEATQKQAETLGQIWRPQTVHIYSGTYQGGDRAETQCQDVGSSLGPSRRNCQG